MYLVKTPKFIKNLFPNFVWNLNPTEKVIYLTFDDGPIPEITPFVLETLAKYDAKASFFCVGENIKKHGQILNDIVDQGHTIGNHTFNHLSGWATENIPYFHNVRHCASMMDSSLFRPPYGRLKPKQVQFLQRHYKIIMWDVLSGDFDNSITPEQCFKNVALNAGNGSIVVFHDSLKAQDNLSYALPKTLEYFSERGFRFENLDLLMPEKQQYNLTA
ncbi:MAG: polysaccharide deacetylase family protein [Bacteroidota bacterium]